MPPAAHSFRPGPAGKRLDCKPGFDQGLIEPQVRWLAQDDPAVRGQQRDLPERDRRDAQDPSANRHADCAICATRFRRKLRTASDEPEPDMGRVAARPITLVDEGRPWVAGLKRCRLRSFEFSPGFDYRLRLPDDPRPAGSE